MELIIEKEDKDQDLNNFISNFLIAKIEELFISMLDEKMLEPISEYINSPIMKNRLFLNPVEALNNNINVYKLAIAAIQHLVYEESPVSYTITISSVEIIPKLTAKLIDIAMLINNGSLGSPAYPIYDKVFDFIAANLPDYYDTYLSGGTTTLKEKIDAGEGVN